MASEHSNVPGLAPNGGDAASSRAIAELQTATDSLLERLDEIAAKASLPSEEPGPLLEMTNSAILAMKAAVEHFENGVGHEPEVVKQAQAWFRGRTDRVFLESHLMKHARTWPMGYPGDFTVLEEIYDSTASSRGIGYYLDRYFLSTTLAVAVRERKETLRALIRDALEANPGAEVFDIACGSCRELAELARELAGMNPRLTCVDYDQRALDFSLDRMKKAGIPPERVTMRRYNALKMTSHEKNLSEFGMQDVIYSVGLFDYLKDEVVARLFQSLYDLLRPGGVFIASFKDSSRYQTFDYHWLVQWDMFLQRTAAQSRALFESAGIAPSSITTSRDRSGVIVFYSVRK